MAMMTRQDQDFLKLLLRSPDRGDGWRSVSEACWQLVDSFENKRLLEIDKEQMRVRLTDDGELVAQLAL
jgi:hypothetical protein